LWRCGIVALWRHACAAMVFFDWYDYMTFVTSQELRLAIERKQRCALHSCIENLANFRAFNETYQSDRGFACVDGN
jgi:hypothetical protein